MNYLSRFTSLAALLLSPLLVAVPGATAQLTAKPIAASANVQIPNLSTSQWSELKKGNTVLLEKAEEDDPRSILGAILIDAPKESTWHVINDKEKGPEFTKGLLRASILERGQGYMLVEQEMKVGVIPGTFTYIMRHEMVSPHRVQFQRLSGDLKEVKGYWKFAPVEQNTKTLLIYSLFIDPGFFLPKGIMERSMKKKVPEALVEIKERTETIHPTLTPEEKAMTDPNYIPASAPTTPGAPSTPTLKPAPLKPTILGQ